MKILEIGGSGVVGCKKMGPVSNVVTKLSLHLAKLGCDVTVADAKNGNRCANLNYLEIDNTPRSKDNSAKNEERFVAQLMKNNLDQYDIIHSHIPLTSYYLHQVGISTVYTAHTTYWCHGSGLKKFRQWISSFNKMHERQIIKNSLLTVALGDYLKVKGANIKVIPSGFDLNGWEQTLNKEKKDVFTILYVGRMVPIKGIHILIQAIKKLSFPVRAIIVGPISGTTNQGKLNVNYVQKLLEMSKGLPVEFTDFVHNTSIQFKNILSESDVMVVPSLFEAQGTVILEGLSMGLPVVASKVGGIPMIINDSVGQLFQAGSVKHLSEKLTFLYNNKDIRTAMAQKARTYVKENFSWEACSKRYLDAMKSVNN